MALKLFPWRSTSHAAPAGDLRPVRESIVPKIRPQVRRYSGARPSRVAGFSLTAATPREENRVDLLGMVRHSRELAQNNDYYRAFLLMCRRHIVGPVGFRHVPLARFPDGRLDQQDNKLLASAFADWSRVGSPTTCGRFSLLDVQWMIAMMVPRDGGVFIRHFEGRSFGPNGYQFQILTIDRLAVDYNDEPRGGGYVHGGVECDDLDRVVAWHFYKQKPIGANRETGQRIRVPADQITYVAVPEDASAHLAMPWAHTTVRRLNLLGGFEEGAATAARAGASKMGFFTRTADDSAEIGADDEPDVEDFAPGTFETLPVGYDFKQFDPGYPDGESPLFVKLMLRGAAAGMGVSYNGLANDLEGTNFSSLHVGRAEEQDEWRILQSWFSSHTLDVIRARWLRMSLLTGAVKLPLAKIDKFSPVMWQPRGWKAVNPKQESDANRQNIESLLTSPQRIAASRGEDWSEVLEELEVARGQAKLAGFDFPPAGKGQAQPPAADDETQNGAGKDNDEDA